jgi:hypothetical protein
VMDTPGQGWRDGGADRQSGSGGVPVRPAARLVCRPVRLGRLTATRAGPAPASQVRTHCHGLHRLQGVQTVTESATFGGRARGRAGEFGSGIRGMPGSAAALGPP